mmetsp:Transcript_31918/g.51707  ORF Transcript_31918/g.51707 Transcript_31918/m.51707 type:complete len:248 (-) Transcript_31918:413-1156(-)
MQEPSEHLIWFDAQVPVVGHWLPLDTQDPPVHLYGLSWGQPFTSGHSSTDDTHFPVLQRKGWKRGHWMDSHRVEVSSTQVPSRQEDQRFGQVCKNATSFWLLCTASSQNSTEATHLIVVRSLSTTVLFTAAHLTGYWAGLVHRAVDWHSVRDAKHSPPLHRYGLASGHEVVTSTQSPGADLQVSSGHLYGAFEGHETGVPQEDACSAHPPSAQGTLPSKVLGQLGQSLLSKAQVLSLHKTGMFSGHL